MALPFHDKNVAGQTVSQQYSPPQLSWGRAIITVFGMLLALLLAHLDQTIVATALPRVVSDLGGFDQIAWVFTAYMLAVTTSIPIMGKLSDMYGRKRVLVGGVVVFLAGSALAGSAQDMTQLILFRAIQGLGAGSIAANSYAVVGDIFPPLQRGKWVGVVGIVFALAIIIGPLAGGYLTDHLSWRWIFFVNLPIGTVALLVILFGMVETRTIRESPSIDYRGAILLAAAVVPLLLALTWAGREYAWASSQIVGMFIFSGLMAALFIVAEARADEPIIPRSLFANPVFTVAVVATFLTAIGMYGGIMFIPLFVQAVIGSSATDAGIVLIPMLLSGVASAVIAGQIISRTGNYRFIAIAGVAALAVGVYLFTRLDADSSKIEVVRYMVIAGAGMGATLPTFMIAVQNAFPHHMLGVATASVQFFRSMGGAIGTAVLASFMTIRLGDWLSKSIDPEAVGALPTQVAESLGDPRAIMNPGAMSQLRDLAAEEENGLQAFMAVEESLRAALASAIHDVFLLGLGITILALVVTIFLRQIPLRTTILDTTDGSDRSSPS